MNTVPKHNYSCFCGRLFTLQTPSLLQAHVINCKEFIKNSPFADLFFNSDLSKLSQGELLTLKFEFEHFVSIIDMELKNAKSLTEVSEIPKAISLKKGVSLNVEFKHEVKLKKFGSIYHNFDDNIGSGVNITDILFRCLKCRKFYYDDESQKRVILKTCGHSFCRACLNKAINLCYLRDNGQMKCLFEDCSSAICETDFKKILTEEKFNKLNEEMLEKMLNIISCIKCKEKFEFIRGKPDPHMKDNMGKPLSLTLALNYAENRFICVKCKSEQCKSCHSIPFHLGFSCESWKKKKISRLCLFCDCPIEANSLPETDPLAHVCDTPDCQSRAKLTCLKQHQCGHFCKGFSKEIICLPCLNDECCERNSLTLLDQKGSDYCNICFVESLNSAPCVQLTCGHLFHLECLSMRIELRWLKPRMIFNFCLCPLCKVWMSFPKENKLYELMLENQNKFELVKSKALDRLKYEQKEKDPRLSNPEDPFYQKPLEYAIAIYSYYECFKCKNPYFGGLKRCEDALEHHGNEKPFKPQELICPQCCDIPIDNCVKHGNDYIEFKCKYCCSLAQWFCWGTTHFCDPCHERINAGDDLTVYPIEKLPLCPGKELCPLKTEHKPNGQENALGCSLCRNYKEDAKDF